MTFFQYQLTEEDEKEALAATHSSQGQYKGLVPQRKTTDCIFSLLILLFWAGMSVIGYFAYIHGDPYRLISPTNDQGKFCGLSEGFEDLPNHYSVIQKGVGVCVKSCPQKDVSLKSYSPDDYYCLHSIHESYSTRYSLSNYIYYGCLGKDGKYDFESDCGCMPKLTSDQVLHRCSLENPEYAQYFMSEKVKNMFLGVLSDIMAVDYTNYMYTAIAGAVFSVVWMTFLRCECLTSCFIWMAMLLIQVIFGGITALGVLEILQWKDQDPPLHTDKEILHLEIATGVVGFIALLWFILMIVVGSSVQVAVKAMALTADCIEHMPMILFTPLLQVTCFLGFLCVWFVYSFYLASEGKFVSKEYDLAFRVSADDMSGMDTKVTYFVYSSEPIVQYQLWFMLFMLFWTAEFMKAMSEIIIAIAVAKWYFTDDRSELNSERMLMSAYYEGVRYHSGTAAFGSLLIAIIETIRSAILYVESKFKGLKENKLVAAAFCCLNCCLWFIEQILRFISKNAYIQVMLVSE
jgi:choline transporter-like protein 2/4/5